MTHHKQDIELVEILQATCADGDEPLRSLLAHTLQCILEEEMTVFFKAESYSRTEEQRGLCTGSFDPKGKEEN